MKFAHRVRVIDLLEGNANTRKNAKNPNVNLQEDFLIKHVKNECEDETPSVVHEVADLLLFPGCVALSEINPIMLIGLAPVINLRFNKQNDSFVENPNHGNVLMIVFCFELFAHEPEEHLNEQCNHPKEVLLCDAAIRQKCENRVKNLDCREHTEHNHEGGKLLLPLLICLLLQHW